ncbi:hypothetical protein L6278_01385 [Candidatus Parcubacteria bacterium]|nr:hypothetical protein [Patescibacteria group bacterium]MBU4481909.1 hypothetical protein [Patescibacteria group bacterium]MCG2686773.1 hypothetical protein [Candidatus Parcubacteria bacterium]
MNTKKLAQLIQLIETADVSLQQAREVLKELGGEKISANLAQDRAKNLIGAVNDKEQIIEGVFNGQNMIGPDGKEYSVPANYASKSKLVEGDILKLTIQANGTFVYKQIKPIQRERVKGKLIIDEVTGQFSVLAEDKKKYNVLTASVTYFKAQPNDDLIIIIPKDKVCQWAVIENVITTPNKPAPEFDVAQTLGQETQLKEPIPVEDIYTGISSSATPESILPEVEELKSNNPETEKAKEKTEEIINNTDLDIDDIKNKDLSDL